VASGITKKPLQEGKSIYQPLGEVRDLLALCGFWRPGCGVVAGELALAERGLWNSVIWMHTGMLPREIDEFVERLRG